MFIWFFVCAIGFILMVPLHFWSVEHQKLKKKFGKEKGVKIGKILGTFSGWMELVFLLGFWISPQPRFTLLSNSPISLPLVNFSIQLSHLLIAIPLIGAGAWIAIRGVREMSRKVGFEAIDAHSKPRKIVKSGPFSTVRHPQYLGANLAHIGGFILFSAFYALLITPVYMMCNYLIAWKEEKELVREFGKEYKDYQGDTPMFIPKLRKINRSGE